MAFLYEGEGYDNIDWNYSPTEEEFNQILKVNFSEEPKIFNGKGKAILIYNTVQQK
ncbi:hypothetical protein [Flammeovirga aprica]|uniref:Uncharacterized protein n=1 Tax=Flammeovirga aprica JL-4 TaxID=694437 RepID=A0A7X9XDR2_9BACT|nr:hypothetical protein [Flammeovirga aprica]NME72929.1 hypothetical protein [Flammeovirga aprica JL-4]